MPKISSASQQTMTGKAYYLTTLGALQRHSARLKSSHWLALPSTPQPIPAIAESAAPDAPDAPPTASTKIFAVVEADEGAHLALEDDPEFHALPHPLAQRPISPEAHAVLAPHGVAPEATTFDATETLAKLHPLLRHRVF
jgi:hypothetical protein